MSEPRIGFDAGEISTSEPTRQARLKWVVVVADDLDPGLQVNAAVCVAASTADNVYGLLGPDAVDGSGLGHPGLPWAGCTILRANAEWFAGIRDRGSEFQDVFMADMPVAAQETRVYDEYLEAVEGTASSALRLSAVSIVGPRKTVDRLVKKLTLLP
jgi:hypothetical protein